MNYKHLTINERCCIYQLKNNGVSVRAIANRNEEGISVPSTSTIYRMIHRKQIKIIAIAERKSRNYIALLLPDRKEEYVTSAIIEP
ncbi:MAG: helix-turn-helix domain-containing protein [Erysipelotrichaceae bacterium]|nr:helix-turn-helix domain-containing protein [Erysipelotrichaceae bacterium]MDY5252582.1 helix-turn-helix domain-containing protein [Erysipelotrichaceae bacterium]